MIRFNRPTTVIFREKDYKKLKEEAHKLDMSICGLLRKITTKYFEQQEQEESIHETDIRNTETIRGIKE